MHFPQSLLPSPLTQLKLAIFTEAPNSILLHAALETLDATVASKHGQVNFWLRMA
jgi:hypothetical protein